ncbi:MAG: Fic family protein [Proteobacteria bacterium]|nr:MAG: Fic family protein [Pseudomonadota bacterium]
MVPISYSERGGKWVMQLEGYKAFRPAPLPPLPPLIIDNELIKLLSDATHHVGQLSMLTALIQNPDLFVYVYVQKEALLSSQIEGTQCSIEDILGEDTDQTDKKDDIEEVSNYVTAMNEGIKRLVQLPVSSRLIKEIHEILMTGVRGSNKTPGEFRRTQNWIGRPGATLTTAEFVPPPPPDVDSCMADLEKYIHESDDLPAIIKAGLVHAQFETIHPFLDGNGRLGRLLITFLLCDWKILDRPLLYLSYFFKAHRTEYYARLTNVRMKGDWEGWIKFFLRGVSETAEMATLTAKEIHFLHLKDRDGLRHTRSTAVLSNTFELFCNFPILSLNQISEKLRISIPTAQRAVDKLGTLGIVSEITGKMRNRRYVYTKYLEIIRRDTISPTG